jgi:hypothetical protein
MSRDYGMLPYILPLLYPASGKHSMVVVVLMEVAFAVARVEVAVATTIVFSPISKIDSGGAQHIGGAFLTHQASLLG